MSVTIDPLPYQLDDLEPFISRRTLEFHHNKHHASYVEKLHKLTRGTPLADHTLDQLVSFGHREVGHEDLFNNAAQAWNHAFYWNSMRPRGGGVPTGAVAQRIEADFGDYAKFADQFADAAVRLFGSGWVWLVLVDGKLRITPTKNADTPIAHRQRPLLVIDVWEHAYYLDYQNRRGDYASAFLRHLADWNFANRNLARAQNRSQATAGHDSGIPAAVPA